jgi:hypothetical protein
MDINFLFQQIPSYFLNILEILLILFLFFLLIREFVTWYWKLNRIVNLLEKIEENTRKENVPAKDPGVHPNGFFGKD